MIRYSKIFALSQSKITSKLPFSFKVPDNHRLANQFSSNQNEKPGKDNN